MADGIVTLTSSTFDETVIGSSKPILVDFWAEWCGPCKMIAPILAEIAIEQKDSLVISKLNVDEHGDIAQRYNVMSIPTLLLFNNGELVKRLVGAKGKGALLQELSEFLTPSHYLLANATRPFAISSDGYVVVGLFNTLSMKRDSFALPPKKLSWSFKHRGACAPTVYAI